MTELIAYEKPGLSLRYVPNNTGSDCEQEWIVLGTEDENVALELLENETLDSIQIRNQWLIRQEFSVKRLSRTAYVANIKYGDESSQKSEEDKGDGEIPVWHFSFDTGEAQHTITHSRSTVASYSHSDGMYPAPDLKKAINWDGQQVKGVEIPIAKPEFSITAYMKPSVVTPLWFRLLSAYAFHTNAATWLGAFGPGELLYRGSSANGDTPTLAGQKVKPIPVTHKFSFSPTLTNIVLSSTITITEKRGWDYLWVHWRNFVGDEEDGKPYPVPLWAFVERNFPEQAFASIFGFGG